MKYKLSGTVMQTVNIELKKGESVYSESGNMSWMSGNIRMETSTMGGLWQGFKRRLAGETIFLNVFTCDEGTGIISFASEFPGKVLPIKFIKGKELICQKDAFMCAEPDVKLEMYFRKKFGVGFFGGEGFIMQKLSGTGIAFVEFDGEITEMTLKKDQVLMVDTGYVAMYEPTIDFDIQSVKGARNIFFGGEGVFLARLKGPGTVWLQSMPLGILAGKIWRYVSTGSSSGGSRTGIGGFIDSIGG